MRLRRRSALALGLVSMACARASASDATALDRFIKMRGALDDRLVIGAVTGQYNGVVAGQTKPLFGLVSAVFSRYRPRPGGYEVVEFEQAYYTDFCTGKVLSHWKNPYTNEVVAVPVYKDAPSRSFITQELKFHSAVVPPPSVHVAHFAEGPQIDGVDIVFVERVAVTTAAAPGKPAFRYADHTTLRAPLSEVDRPGAKMAGSQTQFEAVCSWRPWLGMGARPGHMTASGQGGFGLNVASLPAAWREATARVRPDLLKNPASALE